jgi:class 3 adenylate cyclase
MAGSALLLGVGIVGVAWIAYGRQSGMRRRLTRARSRIERLSRYVPFRFLSARLEEDRLHCVMERIWLVAVFVDLSGFTNATVRCGLADVETLVQCFVVQITSEARRFGGVVMKLMGDGALIVFPHTGNGGRIEAVKAAIGLAESMVGRAFSCGSMLRLELPVRAGIASGECALGDWGADDVLDYSVIGLAINLAARLQSAADDGAILICPETAMHAGVDLPASRTSLWLDGIGAIQAFRLDGRMR